MGDREKASLRLQFNPQIRLELPGWSYPAGVTRLELPGWSYPAGVTRLELPGWSYPAPPSPPTPDCWHSENWMTPWTLPP